MTTTMPSLTKASKNIIDTVQNEINYCSLHHNKLLAPHDNYTPVYVLMDKLSNILSLPSVGFDISQNGLYDDAGLYYAENNLISHQHHASKNRRVHAQNIMAYVSTHFASTEVLNVKNYNLPKLLSKTDIMKIFNNFKYFVSTTNFNENQLKLVQPLLQVYSRHNATDIRIALVSC